MDLVCWQRQIVGLENRWDILIFNVLHHVFHVPQQKTDLFCTVCLDQFIVLTFDKAYQNRIPLWDFSHHNENI